jgi:septal ring factor EnvC (AmiA/AmiB activator)
VPAEAIETSVWAQLCEAIHDPSLISSQWEAARQAGPDAAMTEDRASVTRSLDRLTRQQERLVRRLRDADDEIADLIERELGEVERERKALRATIAELDARLAEQAELGDQLGALVDYCQRVGLHLADFDFDKQRLALRAFRIRVEANGAEKVGPWRILGLVPIGVAAGAVSQSYL